MRLLHACSPLAWGGWAPRGDAHRVGPGRAVLAKLRRCGGGSAWGSRLLCASGATQVSIFLLLRLAFYLSPSFGLPPLSASLPLTLSLRVANSSLLLLLSLHASFSVTYCLSVSVIIPLL